MLAHIFKASGCGFLNSVGNWLLIDHSHYQLQCQPEHGAHIVGRALSLFPELTQIRLLMLDFLYAKAVLDCSKSKDSPLLDF